LWERRQVATVAVINSLDVAVAPTGALLSFLPWTATIPGAAHLAAPSMAGRSAVQPLRLMAWPATIPGAAHPAAPSMAGRSAVQPLRLMAWPATIPGAAHPAAPSMARRSRAVPMPGGIGRAGPLTLPWCGASGPAILGRAFAEAADA